MRTLIATCLLGLIVVGCSPGSVKTKRTTNKQAEWNVTNLNTRYASIFNATNGVGVVEGWPDNPKTSVLALGSSVTLPGSHDSRTYTVLRIEEDGAVFEYVSSFDHRSFGKNLIEEDSGTFKLKWKSAE